MAAYRGGIAQLGERDAGSVEARGSSPLTSTSQESSQEGSFVVGGARANPSTHRVSIDLDSLARASRASPSATVCGTGPTPREGLSQEVGEITMNQVDSSMYFPLGAQPRPMPEGDGEEPSSWRGPLILLAVMLGWMILVFALASATASNDPNVETPVEVNLGVTVTPANGWYSAAKVWDAGPTGISLQNSGAYVAFWVDGYGGNNDDLLAETLTILQGQYGSFRALPATVVTVAGDLPGLAVVFTGTTSYGRVEGELVVATYGGMGVAMQAEAQEGQLAQVQDDLDLMLASLVMPR